MFFPPPPKEESRRGPAHPDPIILVLWWLYAASGIGALISGAGFPFSSPVRVLPPRFRPAWLYGLVLVTIYAAWMLIGITLICGILFFKLLERERVWGLIAGVYALAAGLIGLALVVGETRKGTRQNSETP